jgi:hypothetical protein
MVGHTCHHSGKFYTRISAKKQMEKSIVCMYSYKVVFEFQEKYQIVDFLGR